jgi:excisionase family DNA binding protein
MVAFFQRPGPYSAPGTTAERLLTLKEAAEAVGAKYWHIQRAARAGHFPVYRPYNSRPLVKLSEVVAYIDSCRAGGVE